MGMAMAMDSRMRQYGDPRHGTREGPNSDRITASTRNLGAETCAIEGTEKRNWYGVTVWTM